MLFGGAAGERRCHHAIGLLGRLDERITEPSAKAAGFTPQQGLETPVPIKAKDATDA